MHPLGDLSHKQHATLFEIIPSASYAMMQAAYGQGYELATAALAVNILDRFAATQYIKVGQSLNFGPVYA